MNKYIALLYFLLTGLAFGKEFNCTPVTQIKWESLSDGVLWAKYDLQYTPYFKEGHEWNTTQSRSVTVRAFKINYKKNKLLFHSEKKDIACDPAKERYIHHMILDNGTPIIGAINASFFVMPNEGILGMAVDELKVWSDDLSNQTISSSGIFGINNGIPFLESKDSFISRFGPVISYEEARRFTFAVQAYPKLLINNTLQISDNVMNIRKARTSIGTANDPDEIILVTIDARGESNKTGMTLFEYAHLVKTASCGVEQKTTLNLDGGGSTSFAIPSKNIFEQVDRCRHLGNILTIQSRSKINN